MMENSQALLLALLAKELWQLQGNNIDYAPVLKKMDMCKLLSKPGMLAMNCTNCAQVSTPPRSNS
jgi:hypothetical protein